MSGTVEEVRALLALFARAPWRDLHMRSGGWEIFLAKPGGAGNPMLTSGRTAGTAVTVDAPHLGLFHASVFSGEAVSEGSVIGQIEILGEREDVLADRTGTIAAVLADSGALVEYGTPLVRLAA